MPRQFQFSPQARLVLATFAADPAAWLHGYLIAQQTGLRSGTLYPILIRLADQHLIEARWEDEQPAGRPRRHMYQLTAAGMAVARTVLADAAEAPDRRRPAGGRSVRRLATEGGT